MEHEKNEEEEEEAPQLEVNNMTVAVAAKWVSDIYLPGKEDGSPEIC